RRPELEGSDADGLRESRMKPAGSRAFGVIHGFQGVDAPALADGADSEPEIVGPPWHRSAAAMRRAAGEVARKISAVDSSSIPALGFALLPSGRVHAGVGTTRVRDDIRSRIGSPSRSRRAMKVGIAA